MRVVKGCGVALAVVLLGAVSASAATMAYTGEVVEVADPSEKERKHAVRKFSVKIDSFDYCSRGSFGRESKVGAIAQQKVMPVGTVCVLNGELMNAQAFGKALRPSPPRRPRPVPSTGCS